MQYAFEVGQLWVRASICVGTHVTRIVSNLVCARARGRITGNPILDGLGVEAKEHLAEGSFWA